MVVGLKNFPDANIRPIAMPKVSAGFDYPHFGKVIFIFAAMLFISCAILGGCRRPAEPFCGCARMEGFADAGATFYFLGVNWCGYCKNAKPEWEKFMQQLQDKEVKGVTARYVDCESQPDVAAQFDVKSYPTFILVKANGERVPYEGTRSADAFLAFVEQNVEQE